MRRIGLVVLITTLWGACAGPPASPPELENKLLHVHGLGINPADGSLYVATHFGLFRMVPEGRPVRAGQSRRDMMGFTVLGPDHFLVSGHPDVKEMEEEGTPPLLGLVESRDAGETWETLSLRGSADFHALRVAGGAIFGFNSTSSQFMVSPDGKSWEVRSTVTLFDFAVSEADPNLVVATTNSGVVVSKDGGRSWSEASRPLVALVSWTEGAFWGMGPEGTLYHSPDGAEWHEMGLLPGRPAAFLATPRAFYAAMHDASLYISEDVGIDWKLVYDGG